jgi:mRNA-degrading endonuclease RelE of RelBE toxin-antitoxin system
MTEASRGYKFHISETALTELRNLKRRDAASFDAVIVMIQEIRSDLRACEQLVDAHFADETIRMVEEFRAAQAEGLNVYTVKLYEVDAWRLITAGDHRGRAIAIMSVMHRSRNYESDNTLMEQLRRDYDALAFKRLS